MSVKRNVDARPGTADQPCRHGRARCIACQWVSPNLRPAPAFRCPACNRKLRPPQKGVCGPCRSRGYVAETLFDPGL